MTIATGVVHGLGGTARIAHLYVTTEKGGAAEGDVTNGATPVAVQALGRWRMRDEDVRELRTAATDGRHRLPGRRLPQSV
jgi:hypothetical protein